MKYRGIFLNFFMYFIQHCFIFRLSDSTVSEYAGIVPRTVSTMALAIRRSNNSAQISSTYRLDLIHTELNLIHSPLDIIHPRLDFIHPRLDLIHARSARSHPLLG
jgi:hypothetical protein